MIEEIKAELPDLNVTISANIRRSGEKWLLCMHGLQTNKVLFSNLLEHPDFSQYSFLCPDFIGFGQSEKPEGFTYDLQQQLEAVIALLDHLGIEHFSIIGHSLGGMVGTMMLRNIPGRITALFSIEGNLRLEDCGASRESSGITLEDFERDIYPNLIQSLQNSQEPSATTRLKALGVVPAHVFYKTSRSIVEYSESGELFELFTSNPFPRILLVGQKSSFTSRPAGDNLQVKEINNAGHFVPLDNPDKFEQALLEFSKNF